MNPGVAVTKQVRKPFFLTLFLTVLLGGTQLLQAQQVPESPTEETAYQRDLQTAQDLNAQGLRPEVQLYNLALVDAQHGYPGLALAKLRQALFLKPTFTEARRALQWVAEEAHLTPVLEPSTLLERLRLWAWAYTPPWIYTLAFWICFFFGAWKGLSWLEVSRQNVAQNLERPPLPAGALTLLSLALVFGLLWGLQSWDRTQVERATYIGSSGMRAGPTEEAPETRPLRLGTELVVRREHKDWRLVAPPGGAAGWVPAEELYLTTQAPEELSKR